MMIIAISTDGESVSAHFGRCPAFTIINVEDGVVKERYKVDNPGHHPGFLPDFLHQKGVKRIIAGGMGQRALALFQGKGIEPILGISGNIDKVIDDYAAGKLTGGKSSCTPGAGKGYGLDKEVCDHE